MKCLIVEDNFISRKLIKTYLSEFADCDIAVNGNEAVEAVRGAVEAEQPYDLICLDISMPEMDGQQALKRIREIEKEHGIEGLDGVLVIMTTAFEDKEHIMSAFRTGCEAYVVKPVRKDQLLEEVAKLGLIETNTIPE